jgi:hypothetical protein
VTIAGAATAINGLLFTPGAATVSPTISINTTTDAVVDQNYTCKGAGCAVIIPNNILSVGANVTLAQVNSGFNLIPAITGHTLKINHFYISPRGGTTAGCTDVRLGDSGNANAIVIDPIANLTVNTGNTEATSTIAQAGFGATAFGAGLGINIFKSGASCTTTTSFDVQVNYTINY